MVVVDLRQQPEKIIIGRGRVAFSLSSTEIRDEPVVKGK